MKRRCDLTDAIISYAFNTGGHWRNDKSGGEWRNKGYARTPPTERDILIWTACNNRMGRGKRLQGNRPSWHKVAQDFRLKTAQIKAIYTVTNKAMKELFDPVPECPAGQRDSRDVYWDTLSYTKFIHWITNEETKA